MTDLTTELSPDDAVHALLDTGAALSDPTMVDASSADLAAIHLVPEGYEVAVTDLQEIRERHAPWPYRKTGTTVVSNVESFLAYWSKHALPGSEITVGSGGLIGIIDAHDVDRAGWCQHHVDLRLRESEEWKDWTSLSGKLLPQEAFVEFLEGHAGDVITPDAATMLEVAQSLEARSGVDFKSAYRGADGQRKFKYEETTSAKAGSKGELEIPERITLSLRVFHGADRVEVPARFRYRITGGGLALGYVIDRQADIRDAALTLVAGQVREGVGETHLVLNAT